MNKCKYWDKDTERCFGVKEPFYCSGDINDCTEGIGKNNVIKTASDVKDNFDFFKEFARMCHSYEHDCHKCPLGAMYLCPDDLYNHLEETKDIINYRSAAHKEKTRAEDLKEKFPRCEVNSEGSLSICPKHVDSTFICPEQTCRTCMHDYWTSII